MENFYTVKEVAALLHVRPYTVREMFREGRLSGFKIGKAWRITEAALEADVAVMRGMGPAPPAGQLEDASVESPAPEPVVPPPAPASAPVEPVVSDAVVPPPAIAIAPVELAAVAAVPPSSAPASAASALGVGRLLVFSDTPAQEVYLDGVHRGPTTLDIMSLPVGEHVLQVGDATGSIVMTNGAQMRVCLSEGHLEVIGQTGPMGAGRPWRLLVRIDNQAQFAGAIEILIAAEDAKLTASVFPAGLVEPDATQLTLAGKVGEGETATLFDDTVAVSSGTRLRLAVPAQEAFTGTGEHFVAVNSDMAVSIILERSGLFRSKDAVRFEVERL